MSCCSSSHGYKLTSCSYTHLPENHPYYGAQRLLFLVLSSVCQECDLVLIEQIYLLWDYGEDSTLTTSSFVH
jgi:hypothetical protein